MNFRIIQDSHSAFLFSRFAPAQSYRIFMITGLPEIFFSICGARVFKLSEMFYAAVLLVNPLSCTFRNNVSQTHKILCIPMEEHIKADSDAAHIIPLVLPLL